MKGFPAIIIGCAMASSYAGAQTYYHKLANLYEQTTPVQWPQTSDFSEEALWQGKCAYINAPNALEDTLFPIVQVGDDYLGKSFYLPGLYVNRRGATYDKAMSDARTYVGSAGAALHLPYADLRTQSLNVWVDRHFNRAEGMTLARAVFGVRKVTQDNRLVYTVKAVCADPGGCFRIYPERGTYRQGTVTSYCYFAGKLSRPTPPPPEQVNEDTSNLEENGMFSPFTESE